MAIHIISLFTFLGFPFLFWPQIMDVSWGRSALALLGGLTIWTAVIAMLAPMILKVPES